MYTGIGHYHFHLTSLPLPTSRNPVELSKPCRGARETQIFKRHQPQMFKGHQPHAVRAASSTSPPARFWCGDSSNGVAHAGPM
eukprot:jgi/Botrbrau1/13326/Bobra.0334s0004.1